MPDPHADTCRMVTAKLLTGTDRDCDCGVVYDDLCARIAELEAENYRLSAWLEKIDGGDNPCVVASQLRQWAYEAITLGKECPADA